MPSPPFTALSLRLPMRLGSVSSVADPVAFGPLFLNHTEVCVTMTADAAPRSNP